MRYLTQEQIEYFWTKIQTEGHMPFEDKELEILSTMLQSSAMVKALARIYLWAQEQSTPLMGLDMSDHKNHHETSRAQGRAQGSVSAINILYALVALPEEHQENDDADSADE